MHNSAHLTNTATDESDALISHSSVKCVPDTKLSAITTVDVLLRPMVTRASHRLTAGAPVLGTALERSKE